MNTFETIALMVVGMGSIAGISLAIYSALPFNALNLAAQHGRYSGLGTAGGLFDGTSGNRPVGHVGSLQSV